MVAVCITTAILSLQSGPAPLFKRIDALLLPVGRASPSERGAFAGDLLSTSVDAVQRPSIVERSTGALALLSAGPGSTTGYSVEPPREQRVGEEHGQFGSTVCTTPSINRVYADASRRSHHDGRGRSVRPCVLALFATQQALGPVQTDRISSSHSQGLVLFPSSNPHFTHHAPPRTVHLTA